MSSTNPDEQAPQPAAAPTQVGETLRKARENTGKTLQDVAGLLRIRLPYLQALEDGRHKDLPGGTYAVGFLRTYAEFLGLDGEEMIRRFRDEASGALNARSELVFPSPVSEGRVPGGAVLFVGLVIAALGYGGWYLLSSKDSSVAEVVPALPERLASVLNRQAEVTAPTEDKKTESEAAKPTESPDSTPAPTTLAGDKAEPVPEAAKIIEAEKADAAPVEPPKVVEKTEAVKAEAAKAEAAKAEAVKAEPAKTEAAVAAAPEAAQQTDSRVLLTAASDDCWIQVKELDGQLLISRLLRKGDSYSVPNRPGLTLMVGNAGALEVAVDGKKAPSLGSMGQVRRDIRLDPAKLLGN